MVGRIAASLPGLRRELAELDTEIERRFHTHRHAALLLSLPGMGPVLAAGGTGIRQKPAAGFSNRWYPVGGSSQT